MCKFLSNFNQNWNVLTNFKMSENSVLQESSYSMHMDKQIDGWMVEWRENAKSCYSQLLCEHS